MKWSRGFFDFFLPRTCAVCECRLSVGEQTLCLSCINHLHRVAYRGGDYHGVIERMFWGRFPIERATSFFYYDSVQATHLIHALKYFGRPEAGRSLAMLFAKEMQSSDFFDGVDAFVSLPLHWRKRLKRGYNQSDYIVEGLSMATGIPVLHGVVKRVKNNPSQTHLNAFQRMENVRGIFRVVNHHPLAGRHIMLVDDVLTTGATLTSCAMELAKVRGLRLSIFTLTYASEMSDFQIPEENEPIYELHVRPQDEQ